MMIRSTTLADYQHSGWLGNRVIFREQVASTNDITLEMAQSGAHEGLVVLADEQTAGRGRLKRSWLAPAGTCLLMSLLFRPGAPFQNNANRIPMACGCALIDAIQTVTAVPVLLKWPNDVIIDRQHSWGKLAGMLSEVGLESGQPSVLVVGIGVNVNVQRDLLPQLAPNATSLLVEAGHSVDRLLLLDAFLTAAQQYIDALRDGVDVMQSWQRNLAWMGQPVVITTPDCSVEGVAESVDSDGALILVMPDGSRSRFTVGDVSLRPC